MSICAETSLSLAFQQSSIVPYARYRLMPSYHIFSSRRRSKHPYDASGVLPFSVGSAGAGFGLVMKPLVVSALVMKLPLLCDVSLSRKKHHHLSVLSYLSNLCAHRSKPNRTMRMAK